MTNKPDLSTFEGRKKALIAGHRIYIDDPCFSKDHFYLDPDLRLRRLGSGEPFRDLSPIEGSYRLNWRYYEDPKTPPTMEVDKDVS